MCNTGQEMSHCFLRLDRAHGWKRSDSQLLIFMPNSKLHESDLRNVHVCVSKSAAGYYLLLAVMESLET